jgi:hypothetical protein
MCRAGLVQAAQGRRVCMSSAFGDCSARLQAGILLIAECPPEGGRYAKLPISRSHTCYSACGVVSL